MSNYLMKIYHTIAMSYHMIGALFGDIVGSVFEGHPIKHAEFELFSRYSRFTDDSVLTVATADAIMTGASYAEKYREYYRRYPHAGYGGMFHQWAGNAGSAPYGSFGNGSAMRVSPIGWAFNDLETVLSEAKKSAAVTHNHPEGIKGAQATAASVFLARTGATKEDIKSFIQSRFGYDLSRTLDEIRPWYSFDITCQGSVPESIIAFLESESCEDAIRKAISLGGDADTQACIAGSIAEAYFGLPVAFAQKVLEMLDDHLRAVTLQFQKKFMR